METVRITTIVVDYQKDVVNVFQDFMEGIIHNSNSLDVLFRPWAPDGLYPTCMSLFKDSFYRGFDGGYQ
jgi:hypothetical protein